MKCKIIYFVSDSRMDTYYFFDRSLSIEMLGKMGIAAISYGQYSIIRQSRWKNSGIEEIRIYDGPPIMYDQCLPFTPAVIRDVQSIDHVVSLEGNPEKTFNRETITLIGITIENIAVTDVKAFAEKMNLELMRHTGMKPSQMQPAVLRG